MNLRTIQLIVLAAVVGVAAGVGTYTFVHAKGVSYLTNDPAACANCHIMSEHYSGWLKSSHRSVAVCNDCHTPAGLVPKYLTKASLHAPRPVVLARRIAHSGAGPAADCLSRRAEPLEQLPAGTRAVQ